MSFQYIGVTQSISLRYLLSVLHVLETVTLHDLSLNPREYIIQKVLLSIWDLVEGWDPVNRFKPNSRVAVVTPAGRPKFAQCLKEHFGGVFVLSLCFLAFLCCRGFCHRTESYLFYFSLVKINDTFCPLRSFQNVEKYCNDAYVFPSVRHSVTKFNLSNTI